MVSERRAGFALLLLAALFIAGCEKQPGADTVRTELADLLEREFLPDLFEISSLRRMGSTPLRDRVTGDQRLTVYFNAELRFRRDFDLTAWDGPNAASLAFLLGATEKGILGVQSGGNRAGDLLRVHGSRVYALRRGEWQSLLFATRDRGVAGERGGTRQIIAQLNKLAEQAGGRYGGAEQAVIDRELGASLTRIERQLGQLADILSVASGPHGGAYHRYIQVLEDNVSETGFQVRNNATEGSVDNCRLVQSGAVDLAIAQSNIAALAVAGKGPFTDSGRLSDVRALTALFPEYLHVVVSAGSNIESLAALAGKRIDIGLRDSGTRIDAVRLLDALGLRLPDFAAVHESGPEAAVAALQAGELDAFFITVQAPTGTLQNLLASRGARLLPVTDEVKTAMQNKHRTYRPAIIAAHTYPGQPAPISTLSVTATMIVHADFPESRVVALLDQLFESAARLQNQNLRLTLLNRRSGREGLFIPLHPAAERYFSR